jgi:hypothetical protein
MAVSVSALRKAYESRITAILSEQIAPLFTDTCEVVGPIYFGPDEGVPDPSWWLMIKRAYGPKRTRRLDIIFEIARSSTYGDRPAGAGDGVAFGLRMVDANDTPHLLDSPAASGFRESDDKAGLDASLAAFEGLSYARLLREQGWLTRPS